MALPLKFSCVIIGRKTIIIRNGLPEIVGQFEPDDIIELAQGEDVTARLVKTFSDDNWKVFLVRYLKKILQIVPEKWSVLDPKSRTMEYRTRSALE